MATPHVTNFDIVQADVFLDGDGDQIGGAHTHAPSDITQGGASENQVMTWSGAAWVPATPSAGGGASFAWDGGTVTPGTFTADSAEREVVIELTLDGDPITSGAVWVNATVVNSVDLTDIPLIEGGVFPQVYGIDPATLATLEPQDQGSGRFRFAVMVPAVAGHASFAISVGNDNSAAANAYVVLLLPSGGLLMSSAISIPGTGA